MLRRLLIVLLLVAAGEATSQDDSDSFALRGGETHFETKIKHLEAQVAAQDQKLAARDSTIEDLRAHLAIDAIRNAHSLNKVDSSVSQLHLGREDLGGSRKLGQGTGSNLVVYMIWAHLSTFPKLHGPITCDGTTYTVTQVPCSATHSNHRDTHTSSNRDTNCWHGSLWGVPNANWCYTGTSNGVYCGMRYKIGHSGCEFRRHAKFTYDGGVKVDVSEYKITGTAGGSHCNKCSIM